MPVSPASLTTPGKYVLAFNAHFVAFQCRGAELLLNPALLAETAGTHRFWIAEHPVTRYTSRASGGKELLRKEERRKAMGVVSETLCVQMKRRDERGFERR